MSKHRTSISTQKNCTEMKRGVIVICDRFINVKALIGTFNMRRHASSEYYAYFLFIIANIHIHTSIVNVKIGEHLC